MKSVYYTFTTWSDGQLASGFGGPDGGRQAVIVRQPEPKARRTGGDNVVDLAAWRAANEEPWDRREESGWDDVPEEKVETPVRRERRDHRVRLYTELASILGVIGVLAALVVRVLAF